jgi:inhibitor of KinA sporulation pathway (predicted exonuclease)
MIMARKLDQILVIDLEATCWEGNPPPGQTSEIIEIGLCVLDVPTLARVEQRTILVRPVCSMVSPYCTQLTTLTQADVEGGMPLAEACQALVREYQAPARLWASYGDYDRKQFERNCAEFGIPYPFGPTHLNVKTLAAVVYGWSREVGMSEALKRMGLPLEGTHHRGGDDAWNIAAILSRVLRSSRVGCVEPVSRA